MPVFRVLEQRSSHAEETWVQESEGLDPLGVIVRAWRLLAVSAVLGALVVAAGVTLLPKSYTSSVLVRVTIQQPISTTSDNSNPESPERQVATQQQLVTTDDVVQQVAGALHTTARFIRTHVKVASDTLADTLTIKGTNTSKASAQLLAQSVATTFVTVSHDKALKQLQDALSAQTDQVSSINDRLKGLPASSADHQTTLAQLSAATQLQASLNTAVNSFATPVTVVSNAPLPPAPNELGPKKGAVLGLLLGLVVGCVIAFVRAGRAATGGPIGRLVAATGVPVIATLPALSERARGTDRWPADDALDGGRAAAAALSPAGDRTVLVTGIGAPGQRALVARLVAEAAAAAGRPTTLVDADLRRPASGPAPGLGGLLRTQPRASTAQVRAAVAPTAVPNLSELRSGPDPGLALDLVRGPALPPILSALHRDGELVLVDGPSLDAPEVCAVAEAAGDVVVVVTSTSKPEDVEAGVAHLRAGSARVIGLIEVSDRRRNVPAAPGSEPVTSPGSSGPRWRPAPNGWVARLDETAHPRPAVAATERDAD